MPAFHSWKTRLDEAGEFFPDRKQLPFNEQVIADAQFIESMINEGEMKRSTAWRELLRLGEEYPWLLDGKPYYNIQPKIVGHLCRCKLSNVPSSYMEVPGGFATSLIRFSEPCPELVVEGEEYVRSVLISYSIAGLDKQELDRLFTEGIAPSAVISQSRGINLRIDLGERENCEGMTYTKDWVVGLRLLPDKSLDEEFAAFETDAPERIAVGTRRREVLKNCLRLIATVGLIANSPQDNLLQYDVLSKDRQRFETADEEVRQSLINRARRRGKHGWNVGTNEMIVSDVSQWSEPSGSGQGGQLTHAHIRTGHLHAVRCGPGKKNVKIKWFRPTVVRPDLPFATN